MIETIVYFWRWLCCPDLLLFNVLCLHGLLANKFSDWWPKFLLYVRKDFGNHLLPQSSSHLFFSLSPRFAFCCVTATNPWRPMPTEKLDWFEYNNTITLFSCSHVWLHLSVQYHLWCSSRLCRENWTTPFGTAVHKELIAKSNHWYILDKKSILCQPRAIYL